MLPLPACLPACLPPSAVAVGAGESAAGGIGEMAALPDQVVKSPIPAQMAPGRKWSTVSVGIDHTCGVDALTAQTFCWGCAAAGGACTVWWQPPVRGRRCALQRQQQHARAPRVLAGCYGGLPVARQHSTAASARNLAAAAAACACVCPSACRGNRLGELGNGAQGSITDSPELDPVPVAGQHLFVDLHCSNYFSCARTAEGEAWCWGVRTGAGEGQGLGRPTWRGEGGAFLGSAQRRLRLPLAARCAGLALSSGRPTLPRMWPLSRLTP